jgi:hypothetical protein
MLTSRGSQLRRRGIVLVLVLAMLGLLALVAVTFATFAGQARMNNKSFMNSLLQPQADELIDYALAQLITDTTNIKSVIRGHSLARDMYGNDALFNDVLLQFPNGGLFHITGVQTPPPVPANPTVLPVGASIYTLQTNIPAGFFYGFNFNRWIMHVSVPGTQSVAQTFEILGVVTAANGNLGFQVEMSQTDSLTYSPLGTAITTTGTNLYNPTFNPGNATVLPSQFLINAATGAALPANTFVLDGRWLHAFNGPGVSHAPTLSGFPASYYPNYRYNGALGVPPPGSPLYGLDEDYDACDLENWFLAIQSADGSVMIPSFHRPAIMRFDPPNQVNDWLRQNQSIPAATPAQTWAESAARMLRPCRADGHDAATFPDLHPDPGTGQIPYDVDNDGDGLPDSVWLDLGYPARRDITGRLYKPLFAFMVIGLNGRIPLNTAGNLAAQVAGIVVPPGPAGLGPFQGGPGHAAHLGNSISEVDPTYALQNAFDAGGASFDSVAAFSWPGTGVPNGAAAALLPSNSQVDNAGVDVRLTQLRNLLAGTRPQNNSSASGTGAINGDNNFVAFNDNPRNPFFMPNGIADFGDPTPTSPLTTDPFTMLQYVERSTPPVPGRWGEAQSIPGTKFPNPFASAAVPIAQWVNVLGINYTNPVRAGYSFNLKDILNGQPPDAADDNYNAFDPYPFRQSTNLAGAVVYGGEINDADNYDPAGALVFPVERMRRWLFPADINGTGQVFQWNQGSRGNNRGYDVLGRVEFNSYFRPAGAPGAINTNYTVAAGGVVASANGFPLGATIYPNGTPTDPFYTSGPANRPPFVGTVAAPAPLPLPAVTYLPDMTNNPLHGFEAARFPNQQYYNVAAGAFAFFPQNIGGAPVDQNLDPGATPPPPYPTGAPAAFPTYDYAVNGTVHSDGLNDADETNLYVQNPLVDSPYGPADIEWLYRQQDIDGASLTSRLKTLAPISFRNGLDGVRRRRLFALDSWDSNNFVWANENPGNSFPTNTRMLPGQSPSTLALGFPTPSLAHRDKKINLNYPLPVSNDPNEPIRQKWISDTYQLLKMVLPFKAVDTPEELAQLSQYVINIIDFRDPDSTMTHWVNPDVVIAGAPVDPLVMGGAVTIPTTAITLAFVNAGAANPRPLDQYGMEYCAAALNEVLAYSYNYVPAGTTVPTRWNRFCAELVNTQTSPELASGLVPIFNPVLDLGGFEYVGGDPYAGGSWDIIFTADDPYSRPDPYRGQLAPYGRNFAATPLSQFSFKPQAPPATPATALNNPPPPPPPGVGTGGTVTDGFDVALQPLAQNNVIPIPQTPAPTSPATDYFYAIGNSPPTAAIGAATAYYESGYLLPGSNYGIVNTPYYDVPSAATPTLVQAFKDGTPVGSPSFDPMNGAAATASPMPLYQGVLPGVILPTSAVAPNPNTTTPLPSNYATKLPTIATPQGTLYYWVCLRRPANLFAPVSLSNPMVVVDAVRFPITDATGPITGTSADGRVGVPNAASDTVPASAAPGAAGGANVPYSVQRFQPYRGGHAVPVPLPPGGAAATAATPPTQVAIDPRYGYTEQIVVPSVNTILPNTTLAGRGTKPGTMGVYYYDTTSAAVYYATPQVYHTIGWANEYEQGSGNPEAEPWDYFPFHDRDFTSVAELMLVPGCSPGLFTKQFVEFAPSYANITNVFSAVQPRLASPATTTIPPAPFPAGSFPLPTMGYSPPVYGPPPITPPATTSLETVMNGVPPSLAINPAAAAPPAPPPATPYVQAFATGSAPLLWYSGYLMPGGGVTVPSAISVPMQPHTFPYLNDQFFYSGYGGAATIDTGGQVGGYSADGWFKMFDFFEVPSQAIGAIGPVAQGSNFDWLRQDIKPGQLNLNLIMDEEVFFSVAGQQSINQSNGQYFAADGVTPQTPSDQFSQQLLNFNQISAIPVGNYVNNRGNGGPFSLPMGVGTPPLGPLPGVPPMPMVVTATLADNSPGTAYPVLTNPFGNGLLGLDPITDYLYNGLLAAGTTPVPPYANSLKASWVQFLTLRHGGSGYLFGFGTGAVSQNSALIPFTPPQNLPAVNNLYKTGIPADRPFRSLSYPDIDYTVMRPAALPPSPYTNPVANSAPTLIDPTTTPPSITNIYAGDPGVRNPTLYFPYPSATYPGSLPAGATVGTVSTPSVGGVIQYNAVLPPAIPARRLFQQADLYNPNPGQFPLITAAPTIPPPPPAPPPMPLPPRTTSVIETASNASEMGDPYINNQVPFGWTPLVPFNAPGALQPFIPPTTYAAAGSTYSAVVNNSAVNLYWPTSTLAPVAPLTQPVQPGVAAATLLVTAAGATTTVAVPLLPGVQTITTNGTVVPTSPVLGGNESSIPGGTPPTSVPDFRQHPYWRTEQLQKMINLTTPRTHQFAVWITIGMFEVKQEGDPMMINFNPRLAFDTMGPEIGAANGKNVRFRGFYLVDRLKLTGFNPSSVSAFRNAIVYRGRIQ